MRLKKQQIDILKRSFWPPSTMSSEVDPREWYAALALRVELEATLFSPDTISSLLVVSGSRRDCLDQVDRMVDTAKGMIKAYFDEIEKSA